MKLISIYIEKPMKLNRTKTNTKTNTKTKTKTKTETEVGMNYEIL